jgi:hypothetical protein
VHEAHAVFELERPIPEPGGPALMQLGVDAPDELDSFRCRFGVGRPCTEL